MELNLCAIFLFLRAVLKRTLHLPEMKNIYALLTITALLFVGTSQSAFTQPPPPGGGTADFCTAALPIQCGWSVTDSTTTATNTDQPGICDTDLSTAPGVWYTFVGDGSSVVLSTCSSGTDYDTKIGVFQGPCASLVCLVGNDDDALCANSGLQSTTPIINTTVGVDYYVYVTGFGTNTGHFSLKMTCEPPCGMTSLTAGGQTACESPGNTYDQSITVSYFDPPTTGTLDINGQSFPITGSPQTVALVGLLADGSPVDVTASFSDDPNCTITELSIFTAPANCTATCTATYSGFSGTDYCIDDATVTLIPDPFGGTFSGPGITDDGDAASFSPAGLPLAIPDNVTPGVDADISVSGLGADDVLSSICLEVEHTWVGDVTINLTNPQGTTVALMNRPGSVGGLGFGCSSDNILVTINPGTGNDMEDSCAVGATHAILGTFTAHNGADIASLNAGDPNGTWVISVIDSASGDTGSLIECTLNFGGNGEFDPATAGAGVHDIVYTLTTCEGCVATETMTITVTSPDASFSFVENGLTVDFTANSSTGTYSWDFGDGNVSSLQNPSHTYGADGSYTVSLIVNDGGCADTTSQTVTVVDNSGCNIPTPIITPPGPIDLCPGDSIVLTATNLPAGSGPTIPGSLTTIFDGGNGFDGNMFDVVPTTNITVDDFDVHVGEGGSSDIVEVYYKIGTHVGSEATAGDWTLLGSAAIVSAGAGVPTNLGLSLGLALNSGQTYAFYLSTTQGVVDFDYTDGGTVGDVLASNADLSILEGTGKEYPFLQSFTTRNWNGTLYYSIPGSSDYSLLWSPTGDTTTTTVAYGGSYTVTVDSAGCTATSDPVVVNVLTGPTAAFTSTTTGSTVDFTDLSTGGVISWDWDFGDGNNSTLQNPSHTYGANGSFTVLLTVDDGSCTDTVSQIVTISGIVLPDSCAAADPISCGMTIAGSTTSATIYDPPGICGTDLTTAPGLWYTFTGDGNPVTLDLCNGNTNYDSKLGVFEGPCEALVCVDGNDDFCGLQSSVGLNTTNGTEYFVYVTGFGAATGDFELTMSCSTPITNDSCAAAEPITCGSTIAGSTIGATNLDGPGTCGTDLTTAPGVWYSFTGDGTDVTLDLCNGNTGFDTKLGVFEGPCEALVCVDGNDDFCGLQSSVGPITTVIGTEYFVYVTGFGTSTGDFELTMTCASSCDITSVTAGNQTPCDVVDNTYTQEIIVEYTDAPATGTLDVNGQSFAITTSPQTVVLVGLNSDGAAVDVTAVFSDLASCAATEIALFTAPAACTVVTCPGGTTLIFEDFNGCAMPTGWSTNLVGGVDDWQFGDNGGVDNIDGSCMAYFDDDFIGNAAPASWVELLSPVVDNSTGDNLQLTFDFNYNNIGADSFFVDVWNGATWDNIMLLTGDSIGFWNGGPYPTAVIPMAGYTNADFQVRFSYNDAGLWAWYVGIDNVALCALPVGACDITAATAGTQTPCDPATSTYDQEIIIEYTDAPATGTIDVNGISFPITGSPQTISFTGLPADGLPVDVSVSFSDDPFCEADFSEVWTAPVDCYDPCPGNTTLIWENFNSCTMPVGWSTNLVGGVDDWQFGDNGGLNNIDGSCMAYFDDDFIGNAAPASWVELLSPVVDASSGDNLELSFDFNYNNIGADSFFVDVWNGATWDNVLLLTADSIGTWNGGPYPTAVIPMAGYTNADFQVRFSYNDAGLWAWYVGIDNVALCQIPVGACEITAATAGTQTPCDPATSTYDQDVIIEYSSAPGTGTLDVNGQSFPITGSPQTVTFTGLPADGLAVDVTASFSDDPFCTADFTAVWTAPADCYDPCVGGTSMIWETFNDCQLPAGWTNVAVTGDSLWVIGDNGGVDNIDGSCMAYFDDDAVGNGALPSLVELTTIAVDASAGDDMQLSFDFNYNNIGADSFFVDVWNGATWDNVLLLTGDSIGFWNGGPYPTAVIPLSGYTNADFQVRFSYDDAGLWAWYVGIDNVALCAFPPTGCEITSAIAGTQTPCDPATSLYDQEVIIEYTAAPGSGDLIVNGQTFPITGSPQTVSFTGLVSNGLPNDVSVGFSNNPFCTADFTAVWTAPVDCFDPCPGQTTLLWESFNSCLLPAGWGNNILNGADAWLFTDNAGNNIDGSCMALFDDDAIGAAALPSWVELTTPVIDASSGSNMVMEFDFNYNNLGATDSFYVDVWDGAQWNNVMLITEDSLGFWGTPPYPHAVIPLVGYTNADFQARFVYNDGGSWAWYVGVDNVSICEVPPTSCSIDGIVADAQGPCDPLTNEYTQDLIVSYSSDPGTGTLDVNGVSVAITGSPQTVTLTGLVSDGQPVDVSASFSDDIFCLLNIDDLFIAPETCLPIPINDTCDNAITIACGQSIIDSTIYASTFENPGFCATDLSTAPGMWYTFVGTGDQVNITTCSPNTNYDTKLGLFEGPCSALVCIDGNDDDFTCPSGGLQSSINNFITTPGVEYLIYVSGFGGGTGVFELTLECAPPCEISNATVGAQTPCDPATNTYTQEVTVEYTNAPGGGFLDVNGQQFAITTSPQTVTLVGLVPNGLPVDLNVAFTDNPNCSWTLVEAWTAPEDCTPPACTDPNAVTVFSEDFNGCAMPAGWENNIITGDSAWLFVLNSPDAFNAGNIDGTCMALFDDDYLGSGAPASNVELVTPPIDLSNYADVNLAFDFNFNDFSGETFYVDAWDGTTWNNLMTITGDSIGTWAQGPPYPQATFSMAGYTNSDFQVRFGYNDEGNWGWYVGIDNVEVCGTPTGCPPLPITLDGLTYCVGEDSTLVTVLEPYSMYEWSPMGETGQSIWTVAGNYTVTVTDANGCVDSAMVNVVQVDNPIEPVITVTGDLEFCEGGSAVLSGPPGYSQYNWNTGSTTQDITVFESGIYVLYVTDSIGCSSATSSVEIIVNPIPVASFSYTLTDFTIDLTNLSLNATDYSWTFGDGGFDNTENPAYTYGEGGVYTITLIADNDCGSDTANLTLGVMNIGVQEASGIAEFSMYPNPAHDNLVMDMTLIEDREINVQFFDQLGQVVLEQRNDLRVGTNTMNFNLSHLAQGVYSIRISDDQYTQVVKLVKR